MTEEKTREAVRAFVAWLITDWSSRGDLLTMPAARESVIEDYMRDRAKRAEQA